MTQAKKMIIDDVPFGPTHTNVELGAKVGYKIEQEEVSILSDATALHAYPKEHIVAMAKGLALPRRTLMSDSYKSCPYLPRILI